MLRRRVQEGDRVSRLVDAERQRVADLDSLEAERDDLLRELDVVTDRAALVRVGEADAEEVARERDQIELRLAEVCVSVDDNRRSAAPLQKLLCEARVETADSRLASSGRAVEASRHLVAERQAALEGARRVLADVEREHAADLRVADEARGELAAVVGGIEDGAQDPLAEHRQRQAQSALSQANRDGELVRWAVVTCRNGVTAEKLSGVPERLHGEIRRRVEAERAAQRERLRRVEEEQVSLAPGEVGEGQPFLRLG